MCGIIGLFNIQNEDAMRSEALKMVRKIRHRGPDWSGSYSDENCILMHERLSIVDVEHGAQPLYDKKTKRVLAVQFLYYASECRAEVICSLQFEIATSSFLREFLKVSIRA